MRGIVEHQDLRPLGRRRPFERFLLCEVFDDLRSLPRRIVESAVDDGCLVDQRRHDLIVGASGRLLRREREVGGDETHENAERNVFHM